MLTEIIVPCFCGNKDVKKFMEYDGAMGYEAVVCKECGAYSDEFGFHKPDEWGKQFIQKRSK